MRKGAYYNEIDPFAAQWLRNLIAAGHIAPGDVDERSIEDVTPDDLQNYTQCHFFAGIGVWSYSLCRAGWPDEKPVWTGSCPCQPFSAAGKKSGFDDKRHLWPAWFRLMSQCRPGIVFGEQVASKDGLSWLDLVHLDMETAEYAFAAVDLCAAGVGAPHIRQRLFWVADAHGMGRFGRGSGSYSDESSQSVTSEGCRSSSGMAHCHNHRQQSGTWTGCGSECATEGDDTRRSGKASHLADTQRTGFRPPSPECIGAHQFEQQAPTDVSACGGTALVTECGMTDDEAAHEIRRQEKAMSPEGIKLAEQIQDWARIKNIQISKVQAERLACGEAVTALDTVYRAHPVTGELIATDVNLPWRKILASHKTSDLINRWRLAVK